jgi:hypothetical protein
VNVSPDSSSLKEVEEDSDDAGVGPELKLKAVKALPRPHPYYRCLEYVEASSD